jgi:hypothetical protein
VRPTLLNWGISFFILHLSFEPAPALGKYRSEHS